MREPSYAAEGYRQAVSRRNRVKRASILVALVAAVVFTQLGCGGPALGSLKTINLTTTADNLAGEGATSQLTATGVYTSSDTKDLTLHVTYIVTPMCCDDNGGALLAPPNTITVSSAGLVTAVPPFVCTWVNTAAGSGTGGTSTPKWALTGSYQIVATFQGITSQPVYIGVGSAADNTNDGSCGP